MSLLGNIDPTVQSILTVVLSLLVFFTTVFHIWKFKQDSSFVRLMLTRTYSWWIIFFIYILFFCIYVPFGQIGLCILGLLGFREIIKNSTGLKVPRELLWLSYAMIVLQFVATSLSHNVMSLMVIPFLGIIILTVFCILYEDTETTVKAPPFILYTMMLTSSGFAHLSYLFSMQTAPGGSSTQGLLIYFIFLTQFNDVLQFIWGTIFGKRLISPVISPKKTWEGLLGAMATSMAIAQALKFLTPFNTIQSLVIGFILPLFGFWGDLTISALKRNLKVKDMGDLIPGMGGILDRVDSILLSSIVYFYLIYFWFLM